MVFDYVAGKQDWLASDLPIEGKLSENRTVGSLAERDPPVCLPTESATEARNRLRKQGHDSCVVVNEARIVLGLLPGDASGSGDQNVDAVMEPGPSTFRPHTSADEAADYIIKNKLDLIIVTTSDGRLVGVVRTADLPRV